MIMGWQDHLELGTPINGSWATCCPPDSQMSPRTALENTVVPNQTAHLEPKVRNLLCFILISKKERKSDEGKNTS